MRHLRTISRIPGVAQFEPVLQFVGVLQSMLGLVQMLVQTLGLFGVTPPRKDSSGGG